MSYKKTYDNKYVQTGASSQSGRVWLCFGLPPYLNFGIWANHQVTCEIMLYLLGKRDIPHFGPETYVSPMNHDRKYVYISLARLRDRLDLTQIVLGLLEAMYADLC